MNDAIAGVGRTKYLFCSDLHLNINRRFDDFVLALHQIREIALREQVDAVVVLGDIYTSRRPHPKERRVFQEWVYYLTQHSMEVVILKGNHDIFPDGSHSFSEFEQLNIKDVVVLDSPTVFKGFFLGHMLLREAKIGPEDFQISDAMSAEQLITRYPGCRGYMLGDVHKPQLIKEDPPVMYLGSIERENFGEREDIKRVVIFDNRGWKSIGLVSRPMIQVNCALRDRGIVFDAVTESTRGAIVKIVISGDEESVKKIDEDKVRQNFPDAKELTVEYRIERLGRPQNGVVNESISPGQAVREYLKILDLSDEERLEIEKLGQEISAG